METKSVQGSSNSEIEKDNYVCDNAIKKLNQGTEVAHKPVNVDERIKKKVHKFYFVKFWPCEDQNLKSRIAEAEKVVEKIAQEQFSLSRKCQDKWLYHSSLSSQLSSLDDRIHRIKTALTWKTERLDDLQEAINSFSHRQLINRIRHRPNNLATEKKLLQEINESQQKGAVDLCSSVENFSELIKRMYGKIEFLDKNKFRNEILKKIKWLEKLGKEAIANATEKRKTGNPLFSRKTIQNQVKLLNKIISEELRKEQLKVQSKISLVEKDLKVSNKELHSLEIQFRDLRKKRKEVVRNLKEMRNQQDEMVTRYDRYVSVSRNAREFARKKDIKSLEEMHLREISRFMSRWNTSRGLRCDYEKSILLSLDHRQLSSDGRARNLDEEPINQQY